MEETETYYWYDPNTTEPIRGPLDPLEAELRNEGYDDVILTHEEAVKVVVSQIRERLRFLAGCTNVTYNMEEYVIYISDGGNIVHLIREYDQ